MNLKDVLSKKISVVKEPVIYFLISKNEIVYIGETTNLLARIGQHSIAIHFDSYSFIHADHNVLKRRLSEEEYIQKFQPKYNKKGLNTYSTDPWLRFHKNNNHQGRFVGCSECKQMRREIDKKRQAE